MALYSRSVPHQRLGTGSRLGGAILIVHKRVIGDGNLWCAVQGSVRCRDILLQATRDAESTMTECKCVDTDVGAGRSRV